MNTQEDFNMEAKSQDIDIEENVENDDESVGNDDESVGNDDESVGNDDENDDFENTNMYSGM